MSGLGEITHHDSFVFQKTGGKMAPNKITLHYALVSANIINMMAKFGNAKYTSGQHPASSHVGGRKRNLLSQRTSVCKIPNEKKGNKEACLLLTILQTKKLFDSL